MKVDVSILTPYYDEPLWMLKRNIESVKNQNTNYTVEHIVVIDNPDVSLEILDYLYAETNTHIYRHTVNKGLSAARNMALENSSGEYIMLLDTDDSFVLNRVQMQLDFMKKKQLKHCYGGYKPIHGNMPNPEDRIIMPPEFNIDYLLDFDNICYCGSNCFKREIYEELGGFDDNMKDGAEDLDFWIRIASNEYRVGLLPEVLYYLGVTNQNMTAKLLSNGGFNRAYEYIRTKYTHLKFTT